jgi:hypothetical protein
MERERRNGKERENPMISRCGAGTWLGGLVFILLWLPAGCGGGGGGEEDAEAEEEAVEEAVEEDAADPAADDPRPDAEDPSTEDPEGPEGDVEADMPEEEIDPTAPFERFCRGEAWDAHLVHGIAGELTGEYMGYNSLFDAGDLEAMKIVPEHPMHVTKILLAFARRGGTAKIRLMNTFGRSYPMSKDDLDAPGANLMEPVELVVSNPDPETWLEIDVSDRDVFLMPTQHYVVVYEHLAGPPYLAVEHVGEGDMNRAAMYFAGDVEMYGSAGNFRMKLEGDFFCAWSDEDRWFGESEGQPFAGLASGFGAFSDLDGDGHDDVIVNDGRAQVFLGDGLGGFAAPAFEAFPDVLAASILVLADVDNDGDRDAFVMYNVGPDGDGDGTQKSGGDCDDADAAVGPSAAEVAGNGKDDDCDGVADDGTDTSDADGDGAAIADGDCNDTLAEVAPGAPELLDGRDNDCDGLADEDFVNRVLLNDGTGLFSAVAAAGVETLDPSAAAGFGDGNGDGVLDLYWGNWLIHYPNPPAFSDHYVTGNGDGTFNEATDASGMTQAVPRACYGVTWNDYDNDGLQDIFVGNYGYGLNDLWHNLGGGIFEDVGDAVGVARDDIGSQGGNTYGADFGDLDNDGDMDVFIGNIAHPRYQPWSDISQLLINQGPPDYTFVDMREALGLVYDEGQLNGAFADYDNDMDLDLAIGAVYPTHYTLLYRNDGPAGFTDVTYESNTAVHTGSRLVWSDVDEDGDPDLLVVDGVGPTYVTLFINRVGQDSNWVEIVLRGVATNRDAVGARVTLTAGGVTQMRDVAGGGGHADNQGTRVVHFGLADAAAIDEVTVRWAGGSTEDVAGLAPNGRYLVVEGTGAATLLP